MIRTVNLRSATKKRAFFEHIQRSSISLLTYKTATLIAPVDNGILHFSTLSSWVLDTSRIVSLGSSIMVGIPNPYSLRSSISTSSVVRASFTFISRTSKRSFCEATFKSSRNNSRVSIVSLKSTQALASRPELRFYTETTKRAFYQHTLKSTTIKHPYRAMIAISLHSTTILSEHGFIRRYLDLNETIEISSTFSGTEESLGEGEGIITIPLDFRINTRVFDAPVTMAVEYKHIPLEYFDEVLTPVSRMRVSDIIYPDSMYMGNIELSWVEGVLYPVYFRLILSIERDIKDMQPVPGDKLNLPIVNTNILINPVIMQLDLTANYTAFNISLADFGLILGIIQTIEKPEEEYLEITRYDNIASFPALRLPVTISRFPNILHGMVVTNDTLIGPLEYWRFENINLDVPPSQQDIQIGISRSVAILTHKGSTLVSIPSDLPLEQISTTVATLSYSGSLASNGNGNRITPFSMDTVDISTIPDYFLFLMSIDVFEREIYPLESFTTLVVSGGVVTGEETIVREVTTFNETVEANGTYNSDGVQDLDSEVFLIPIAYSASTGSWEMLEESIETIKIRFDTTEAFDGEDEEPSFSIVLNSTQMIMVDAVYTVKSRLEANKYDTFGLVEFDIEIGATS